MSRLYELLVEYKQLGIPDQIDYDKLYLYSIITHSTAVEGSTITEIENRLMFDEGISPDKSIDEQLMNLDLKCAYERAKELAKNHTDYTVELLCQLAGLVMKNTGTEYKTLTGNFSSANGDLRRVNVTAGRDGKSYMSYQKVPQRLEDFCVWLNERRKRISQKDIDEIYELSFMVHYNLVSIHPWADGNGRMSRLLMNMVQIEYDVVPSIVKREGRDAYIKSLAKSQDDEDPKFFIDYMIDHHVKNLEDSISEFKRTTENDTLNLKNDTLNDTINLSEKESVILELIKGNTDISITEIVEITGFGRATVTRAIKALKENQLIDRVGAKKNGHWVVME